MCAAMSCSRWIRSFSPDPIRPQSWHRDRRRLLEDDAEAGRMWSIARGVAILVLLRAKLTERNLKATLATRTWEIEVTCMPPKVRVLGCVEIEMVHLLMGC